MRISIDFKNYVKQYEEELKKREFEIYYGSTGNMWVDNINVVCYSDLADRDGFKITLENKTNLKQYSIYLEDIEYFEIHSK